MSVERREREQRRSDCDVDEAAQYWCTSVFPAPTGTSR
jgi:hypothetical protein